MEKEFYDEEQKRALYTVQKKVDVGKAKLTGSILRKKSIAGLLAVFLGMFGIHSFYLKKNRSGIRNLLLTILGLSSTGIYIFLNSQKYLPWICTIPAVIAGILYLISLVFTVIDAIKIFLGKVDLKAKLYDVPIKEYKSKKYNFEYIVPKAFDELAKQKKEENVELNIIGNIKPWKKFKENDDKDVAKLFKAENAESEEEKRYLFNVFKEKKKYCYGFAYVGNNNYIRVQKRLPLILWILLGILILAMIFGLIFGLSSKKASTPSVEQNQTQQQQETQKEIAKKIHIPGYPSFTLSDSTQALYLSNPKANDVYFVYSIYDNDAKKSIYQSKFIEPNTGVNVFLYDKLANGDNNVTIYISTFNIEAYKNARGDDAAKRAESNRNGANQKIVITKN